MLLPPHFACLASLPACSEPEGEKDAEGEQAAEAADAVVEAPALTPEQVSRACVGLAREKEEKSRRHQLLLFQRAVT